MLKLIVALQAIVYLVFVTNVHGKLKGHFQYKLFSL